MSRGIIVSRVLGLLVKVATVISRVSRVVSVGGFARFISVTRVARVISASGVARCCFYGFMHLWLLALL